MEPLSLLERRLAGALVRSVFIRDRRGGPWAPPAHLAHRELTFEGNTGATLHGTWFPHERPRGAVVLAHPDRRYGQTWYWREGWIDFLQEHGYEALTFDFVGYGRSRGPSTYYHEDVLAAARLAREWSGGLPVHVVGVSLGAFAAANASPRLDFVDSLVLESPYPSFNAWYQEWAGRLAMDAFDRVFPRTGRAIKAGRNIAHALPRRLLVAIAEEDEVTPPALSEAVAAAAPDGRTRVLRISGARHLEPFAKSDAYRAALLETWGGGSRSSRNGSTAAASSAGRV